ncbi:MAG: hypothetical protein Q8M95_08865 [Candidatus Methanoperedens sp.]|nr:hypothetical protein [Candidatus Methanoperedens sp.]
MRQIKLFTLLFLLLLIPSVSAYQNIPIIGNYYEYAMEVNLHLGDNTDNGLMPPAPTGLSYTNTFSFYGSPKRHEVRLLLTTVNVQPSAAKDEREYNDLVYLNGVIVGKLNDKTGTDQQDYDPRKMEFIFSSDMLREGENTLMITSGSNLDGTNYDDFAISTIYMEQYGKVRHWLFSYIAPEIVVLVLVVIMIGLAVYGYLVHRRRKLSVTCQMLLVGGLGAIMGIILIINIQDNMLGLLVLLFLAGGSVLLLIGLAVLVVVKYLFHRGILPAHFLFLLRPLVFLVLTLIFMFISYQYLYFDPGGPKPTYGVPVHRPDKE